MSMKSQFKTDPTKVRDGVWFGEGDYEKNSDGTQPEFLIARISAGNPKYSKELLRYVDLNGDRKLSEEENQQQGAELLVDTVLLGWKNFQPEDNGVVIPYTRENAMKIVGDPAWLDLVIDIRSKALKSTKYRAEQAERKTKN